MLMDKETIINLYKESFEKGDPVKQIKSLAKANNVKATFIKKILSDAGLEVPDHIPTDPMKKDPQVIEAADPVPGEMGHKEPKAAVVNEDFEREVQDMISRSETENKAAERQLPVPDAVRECLMEGLDKIDAEIQGHQKAITQLENKYRTIASYIGN
ncbi:MAG: hypothetical protein J6I68_15160 [Butyrivibrio sp.]|uniref:hypothetical protein n=1 Tax=Butyrivibrio sp. TaxID=28121 RepID=UPI001B720A53|nr:hypothetical protein [Butyrivibrio sp.]MBP3784583.1 hypothetical protein [Butyrivibrio sp.]